MILRCTARGAIVCGAGLALLVACGEPTATTLRPKFTARSGVMAGLDESQRRPASGQWGGDEAFAHLAAAYPDARKSSEPLMQTIAWWQQQRTTSSKKNHGATLNYSTETLGGDYFIIEGSDVYAPEGRTAQITNASMTAGRMGNDAPINIYVAFKFEGSHASNNSTWNIKKFGETEALIDHPLGSFGSTSGSGATGAWAGQSTENTSQCNVMVKGTSYHEAWFDGKWTSSGGSISVNPNQQTVTGTVNIVREKTGAVNATSPLSTHYDCPPPDIGGGGYSGDECTVWQEWYFYDDDGERIEWWEPEPGSPAECQEWET